MYGALEGERWPKPANDKKPTNLRYLRSVPLGEPLPTAARSRPSFYHSIVGVEDTNLTPYHRNHKAQRYRRLDYWVIIGNFVIFRGRNSPLLALGFLIAWRRPEWKSVQAGENKTKRIWNWSHIFREHNGNLSAPDAYHWSRWWWNRKS